MKKSKINVNYVIKLRLILFLSLKSLIVVHNLKFEFKCDERIRES